MSYDYTKLNIGKLDYEGIKTNLVNFLKSQPKFENFDFDNESSSLNIFLDILAANTAYNGYYLHSVLTNAFPTTAKTKRALLLNAALSGVFIPDNSSARCTATVTNSSATTLPAFSTFNAVRTNGSPCFFYNLEPIPNTPEPNTASVTLVAGKRITQFSNFDYTNKVIEIPLIYDADSLVLQVQEEVSGNFEFVTWTKVSRYSNIGVENAGGKVYTIKNGPNSYYVTTNIPGALTPSGAVRVIGIESLGSLGNGATITGSRDSAAITVVSTGTVSGGTDTATKDYIRSYSAYISNTKDRIVTQDDYIEGIYEFLLGKGISVTKTDISVTSPSAGTIKVYVPNLSAALQTELITDFLAVRKIAGIVVEYGQSK